MYCQLNSYLEANEEYTENLSIFVSHGFNQWYFFAPCADTILRWSQALNHRQKLSDYWNWMRGEGGVVLLLISFLWLFEKIERPRQNQFEFSESWNTPQFHCCCLWSTLAYMGLHESWLKRDLDYVNKTENKCVHQDSKQIRKTGLNQVGNGDQRKTADADDSNCIR